MKTYCFTGIQHTKSGNVIIPVLGYETKDAVMDKWHNERAYAYANMDLDGLTSIIFDEEGMIVLVDHWMRGADDSEKTV